MAIKWRGNELYTRMRKATDDGVIEAAETVLDIAVKKILAPGRTGRIYNRAGRLHQASAPGEPPANETGQLARSGIVRKNKGVGSASVVFEDPKASWLEFGTSRMEPRPFLRPALFEGTKAVRDAIVRHGRKVVK